MAKQRRLNLQSVWPPGAVLSWHWELLVTQEQIRGPFAALSWLRPLSWMENVKMFQDPEIREQECLLRNCLHSVPSSFSEGLGPGHAESHISPQLYLSGCTSSSPLCWWPRLDDREKVGLIRVPSFLVVPVFLQGFGSGE